MNTSPIVQSTQTMLLLCSISLINVGCSQTVTPPADSPIVASSATPIPQAAASPETSIEPSLNPEPKPEPVAARSLTSMQKSTKEPDKVADRTAVKPIANRASLFSCMTDNGQEIALYETDETIDYSFGEPNAKPELELKVPRGQASTWQWKGVGRAMTYAVDVPNGDTSYSVFWSVDRLSPTKEIEAGVRVHSQRKTLATIYCTSKIVSNLQGVQLKPTEY